MVKVSVLGTTGTVGDTTGVGAIQGKVDLMWEGRDALG